VYQPQLVADAILYAAEHPTREIVVGGTGKTLIASHALAPRLTERMLSFIASSGQRTDEPKSEDAPDNLYRTLEGFDHVEGNFRAEARETSVYTWLAMHPTVRSLIAGTALVIAAMTVRRSFK
jgi:hypothetical protein